MTKIIEDAVSGLDKVSAVYATSSEGISFVNLEFMQNADVNLAVQDAQRKVNEITYKLPGDAKTPTVTKFALDERPVIRMGATSSMSSREFYQFLKAEVGFCLSGIGKIPGLTSNLSRPSV